MTELLVSTDRSKYSQGSCVQPVLHPWKTFDPQEGIASHPGPQPWPAAFCLFTGRATTFWRLGACLRDAHDGGGCTGSSLTCRGGSKEETGQASRLSSPSVQTYKYCFPSPKGSSLRCKGEPVFLSLLVYLLLGLKTEQP